uniref:Uncharacterized protein n=1 Tax=Anguilla anguilla TaxID=7936 RepID=A0A0E9W4J5_ANGAN
MKFTPPFYCVLEHCWLTVEWTVCLKTIPLTQKIKII